MFVLRVPLDRLVPDEDEVNCMVNWPLSQALGYEDGNDPLIEGEERRYWSLDIARAGARGMLNGSGTAEQVEKIAFHIDRMIAPVCGPLWDRDPEFFHPEAQEGWNCPNWMMELFKTEEGRALYRTEMDAICKLMAGLDPEDYPCGLDACRGRVVEPIVLNGPDDQVTIIGFGTPEEPFLYYSRPELLDGSELRLPDDVLDNLMRVPAYG